MPWKARNGVAEQVDQREAVLDVGEEGAVADELAEVEAAHGVEAAEVDRAGRLPSLAPAKTRRARLLRWVTGMYWRTSRSALDEQGAALVEVGGVGDVEAPAPAGDRAPGGEDRRVADQGPVDHREVVLDVDEVDDDARRSSGSNRRAGSRPRRRCSRRRSRRGVEGEGIDERADGAGLLEGRAAAVERGRVGSWTK